jgi:epoxyqueuosine reductase
LKILLHICCAPCSIYPIRTLKNLDFSVMGFFYPHNIHPYTEMKCRKDTLVSYANRIGLRVIYQEGYHLEDFLRNTAFRENSRCYYCYYDRLKAAALLAKHGKFEFFTSTLLYSKFQKHDLIKSIGENLGKLVGVDFYYNDFRKGWKEGIAESKALQMYRQQYCGCIYSEKERFTGKSMTQEY